MKKMKTEKKGRKVTATILFVAVMIAIVFAMPASASISPDTVEAELAPCESITVDKEVHIEKPVKADVIFAFDLTGSMGSIITTAKAKSGEIMTKLGTDYPDVDFNYGVMSYMDYPHSYSSCGYSRTYGSAPDYAYSLDQSLTSNQAAVTTAINGLTLGYGADGPQDYTRIMYESYADLIGETNPDYGPVGWRTGAKKLVVNFGDNVPHDCDLNGGVGDIWTTGKDPGRDELMDTADDLDLQTVLANMAANDVTLLECHTSTLYNEYWTHWTGITGGGVYITGSGTLVNDVVGAITAGLETPEVYGLHLAVTTSGFEDWLVSVVPDSYPVVSSCETVTFEETIHVPDGTEPGEYTFIISALDEKGVSYGDQTVIITVRSPWDEINKELDALIDDVNAATMPNIIKNRLIDKLEYAKALKDNAHEECLAGNFDAATKKLGVAKNQVESFASMVKITRRISAADKASFLADANEIIEKIEKLIEHIETEHKC